MKKVARLRAGDPTLRKLALNILQEYQIPSNFFINESLAIGDYVKNSIRYVRDPDNIEQIQDPIGMLRDIQSKSAQGDCDDMALFTATLLLTIGHQPFFRAVRYSEPFGNYNHIYVVDYENNPGTDRKRVVIDCILKDKPIGFEIRQINGDEFAV